jgi:hypothetical protein
MKKKEAWWVCDKCGFPLVKKGKKGIKLKMLEHRKTCHQLACFYLKQIIQGTK